MRHQCFSLILTAVVCVVSGITTSPSVAQAEVAPNPLAITNGLYFHHSELTPVAVIIFTDRRGNAVELCSGSLIGKRAVLTAAHCVREKTPRGTVYVGGVARKFKGASIHPHYAPEGHFFDVAVLKLSKSIRTVQPAAVYTSSALPGGTQLSVFGYGNTETGRVGSLFMAYLPIGMYFHDGIYLMRVGSTNICFGDSGGPAAVLVNGRFTVVGVASTIHYTAWGAWDTGIDICLNSSGMTFMNLSHPEISKFIRKKVKDAAFM